MYPKHIKSAFVFLVSAMVILAVSTSSNVQADLSVDNLLKNPGLNGDYYNAPGTNHFVAPDWLRWIIPGTWVPEYVDTPDWYGGPIPAYEGDNSQRWHSWNGEYYSGLYQIVENIEPCTRYEFTMWSRKSPNPTNGIIEHRIGIDPYGTQYTPSLDPKVDSPYTTEALLANIVWSADHNLLGVWEQLSVNTEALSSKISAVMFSKATRPDDGIYQFDSFYDLGSLTQVDFPDGKLPAPEYWSSDGVINDVNVFTANTQIIINWETTVPASTQVWYDYTFATTGTVTEPMSYTLYSPTVYHSIDPTQYSYATELDTTPTTSHSVTITGLPENARVMLVPVSRHVSGSECVTAGYKPLIADLP